MNVPDVSISVRGVQPSWPFGRTERRTSGRDASLYINECMIVRADRKVILKVAHGINKVVKDSGLTSRMELP